MKRLSALLLAACLAAPAMAGSCPMLAAQIDQKLASQEGLPEKDRKKIQKMRDKGMNHHQQGDHAKSVEILNKALARLDKADE